MHPQRPPTGEEQLRTWPTTLGTDRMKGRKAARGNLAIWPAGCSGRREVGATVEPDAPGKVGPDLPGRGRYDPRP